MTSKPRANLAPLSAGPIGAHAVDVRPLVKHVLSRELQLYFDRLTASATNGDESIRLAALASLRADTGLAGLVPYLVQWVGERVRCAARYLVKRQSNLTGFVDARFYRTSKTRLC